MSCWVVSANKCDPLRSLASLAGIKRHATLELTKKVNTFGCILSRRLGSYFQTQYFFVSASVHKVTISIEFIACQVCCCCSNVRRDKTAGRRNRIQAKMTNPEVSSDRLSPGGLDNSVADRPSRNRGNSPTVCTCRQSQSRRRMRFTNGLHCQHHKARTGSGELLKAGKLHTHCRVDNYTMTSSMRLCLYGFITWLLVADPLVCDILRQAASWTDQPFVGRTILAGACRTAQVPGDFRPSHRFQPLKLREFVPRYSEQSPIASGPAKGPIPSNSSQLVTVITTMIVFKDDEANMEDRKMTKVRYQFVKCKEKYCNGYVNETR